MIKSALTEEQLRRFVGGDVRDVRKIEPAFPEKQLRRLVEGGVRDVLKTHPDYFTERGRPMIIDAVTKRVVGTIRSFAAQAAEGRDPEVQSGA